MGGMTESSWKCAVLFERIGPYHHARLSALGKQVQTVALEMFAMDSTYAWNKISRSENFERWTLLEKPEAGSRGRTGLVSALTKALEEVSPDVVAIPGWIGRGPVAALNWCVRRKVPAVVMSASSAVGKSRTGWRERCKRRIVRLYSAGLGGGTPQVDYLASLGISKDRLFPGYNVVDNRYFAEKAAASRQDAARLRKQLGLPLDYFLSVCRFIEEKNLPRMLQAYADYRKKSGSRSWKYVLLGDGPLRGQVVDLRERLQLQDSLLLPGFKQMDELPSYYGLARAFIIPSLSETWGLVTNEAMAAGLPVLVSSHCGCAIDLVREGYNGFTFHPTDSEHLTQLMLKLSGGDCDLDAMGLASQKLISQWTPETFAANLKRASEIAQFEPVPSRSFFDAWLLRMLAKY
jgi:glycosyltransferase involved in cell wall biosynthesis